MGVIFLTHPCARSSRAKEGNVSLISPVVKTDLFVLLKLRMDALKRSAMPLREAVQR